MGVQIADIVTKKEISLENLSGRKIAIDAFNSLYQFLSIIRQPDGTPLMDFSGRVTSHLSGIFYRTARFVEAGIKPCYVFDGKPPEFKGRVLAKRSEVRDAAEKRWGEALKAGDLETARKAAQASSRLNEKMIEESVFLLARMGIPVVRAPSEGEAQAAHMVSKGSVWSVASQDYDSLLFGSARMIRNLTIAGRRKIPRKETFVDIGPELLELESVTRELGITREQLIVIGVLVGTDFNPGGIKGIGPKRALALVKEKGVEEIFSGLDWEFDVSPETIMTFFLNPPSTDEYELVWSDPDVEGIKKLMVDEHNFSEERVEKVVATLVESRKRQQSSLGDWLGK